MGAFLSEGWGGDTVLEELGTASQQRGAEPQPHAWFHAASGHAARPHVDVSCRNPGFCGEWPGGSHMGLPTWRCVGHETGWRTGDVTVPTKRGGVGPVAPRPVPVGLTQSRKQKQTNSREAIYFLPM